MSESDESNEQRVTEFKAIFSTFDTDGDGVISTDELGAILRSVGKNLGDDELRLIVSSIDTDGNGTIEFPEFLAVMAGQVSEPDRKAQLREAFARFDHDSSGKISAKELRQAMASLGEELTDEELDAMMNDSDSDGDGEINFEEFVAMMSED